MWATDAGGQWGGVSPDGSLMTYVDWDDLGNLAIRNLATGEHRRLTHTADDGNSENGGKYAGGSRMSPDGDQVVYSWSRSSSSPVGETGELRLLPVHGDRTEPHTVWSPADGSWAEIQDWFPSGDRVVAVVNDGYGSSHYSIVTVSMLDGQAQQVTSIDWTRNPQVRVSPDGRYLAYSRSASREAPENDIFLVAVDGSSDIPLVQHAADDVLVAWSRDGQHLLFNSDRSGQPGLWAQRVHAAAPVGEPQLLIANVDVGVGMGITRDGTLHYAVRVTRRRLKIAELDLTTGRLLRQPVNVTDRFVGSNNVGRFSPDGETLAYISTRRAWGESAIVIQSLKTGEERDLPHELQRIVGGLLWRPDSRLMVRGEDNRGRSGFFDVDVATGQTRLLINRPDIPGMVRPVLTPDGTQILHRNTIGKQPSLYSYHVADGSVRALPGVFVQHEWGGPFGLSPDGQWIANHRQTEMRLHPAVGGDGQVLATTDERHPFGRWTTWTKDGTALLVLKKEPQVSEDMWMWRLWVVPVDGSDPVATELVYEPANAGDVPVDIHPDGKRVVYTEGGYFYQFWAVHNLGLD